MLNISAADSVGILDPITPQSSNALLHNYGVVSFFIFLFFVICYHHLVNKISYNSLLMHDIIYARPLDAFGVSISAPAERLEQCPTVLIFYRRFMVTLQ